MLVEMVVENYAVVDRLRVRFHSGLNLLTGETGSGKSILVDALSLIFGGRASAEAVRSGAESARITAVFELPADPVLLATLADSGIEAEEGDLILEREVSAGGKSRGWAGGRPISASFLRELAAFIGDIHGQHDQQLLFDKSAQMDLLDSFAGAGKRRDEVDRLYREWRRAEEALLSLEKDEQQRMQLVDLWSFQRREIEQAAPTPGEDAALENERRILMNLTHLQQSATAGYEALYESEDSALVQVRSAVKHIEELTKIDDSLEGARQLLEPLEIAIEEAALQLRDYLSRLEADPDRLETIESRLALLDRLKRKYGCASMEALLAHLASVTEHLDRVENQAEHRKRLTADLDRAAREFESAAEALSEVRREAARELQAQVIAEIEYLAMGRSRFVVKLDRAAWSASGLDRVDLLFSANPGEELKPLEKIASGGELSRIALALKTCVARSRHQVAGQGAPRTLVFDEIDSGIGGRAAESVGRRLKELAAQYQVLCVTHQPQIAAYADHHYQVEKAVEQDRTVTRLTELTRDERIKELGRMLSGDRLTPEALRHAEQLIQLSREAAGAQS